MKGGGAEEADFEPRHVKAQVKRSKPTTATPHRAARGESAVDRGAVRGEGGGTHCARPQAGVGPPWHRPWGEHRRDSPGAHGLVPWGMAEVCVEDINILVFCAAGRGSVYFFFPFVFRKKYVCGRGLWK